MTLPEQAVCPYCQHELQVLECVTCDGHVFPVIWHCPEHGAQTPVRSATAPQSASAREWPDWSAA